eukprot:2947547-Pleurochrysis_carterae.AAC.3
MVRVSLRVSLRVALRLVDRVTWRVAARAGVCVRAGVCEWLNMLQRLYLVLLVRLDGSVQPVTRVLQPSEAEGIWGALLQRGCGYRGAAGPLGRYLGYLGYRGGIGRVGGVGQCGRVGRVVSGRSGRRCRYGGSGGDGAVEDGGGFLSGVWKLTLVGTDSACSPAALLLGWWVRAGHRAVECCARGVIAGVPARIRASGEQRAPLVRALAEERESRLEIAAFKPATVARSLMLMGVRGALFVAASTAELLHTTFTAVTVAVTLAALTRRLPHSMRSRVAHAAFGAKEYEGLSGSRHEGTVVHCFFKLINHARTTSQRGHEALMCWCEVCVRKRL